MEQSKPPGVGEGTLGAESWVTFRDEVSVNIAILFFYISKMAINRVIKFLCSFSVFIVLAGILCLNSGSETGSSQ